jgi:hypothetical protein
MKALVFSLIVLGGAALSADRSRADESPSLDDSGRSAIRFADLKSSDPSAYVQPVRHRRYRHYGYYRAPRTSYYYAPFYYGYPVPYTSYYNPYGYYSYPRYYGYSYYQPYTYYYGRGPGVYFGWGY